MNAPNLTMPNRKKLASLDEFQVNRMSEAFAIRAGSDVATFDTTVCPDCGGKSRVIDSRPSDAYGPRMVRRTRRCQACGTRIMTLEMNAAALVALLESLKTSRDIAHSLRNYSDALEGFRK